MFKRGIENCTYTYKAVIPYTYSGIVLSLKLLKYY